MKFNPGVSEISSALLYNIGKLKLSEVRKLAFAQQLVSGAIDSGFWGGQAKSNVEVRVTARNKECCRILDCFLKDSFKSEVS